MTAIWTSTKSSETGSRILDGFRSPKFHGALASCRLCEKSAAPKLAQAGKEIAPLDIRISAEQVLAAGSKTDEWLTYSGSLDGRRYSPSLKSLPRMSRNFNSDGFTSLTAVSRQSKRRH